MGSVGMGLTEGQCNALSSFLSNAKPEEVDRWVDKGEIAVACVWRAFQLKQLLECTLSLFGLLAVWMWMRSIL